MLSYEDYLSLVQTLENLCNTETCAQLVFDLRTAFATNCTFA